MQKRAAGRSIASMTPSGAVAETVNRSVRHLLDRLMVTAVDGTGVALAEGLFHDASEFAIPS